MNAKEEIKKLQEQLDNLKAELDKPEFEVGDWVIAKSKIFSHKKPPEEIGRVVEKTRSNKKTKHNKEFKYHVDYAIVHESDFVGSHVYSDVVRKATRTEIETALRKEAERRGFKRGVKYKGASYNWTEYIHGSLEYFKDGDVLTDGYGESVYKQGKWAEILEDKVKFFDWDVEYTEYAVRIGNTSYPKEWLRNTKELLDSLMEDDLDFYNISEVLTELEKLDLD